MATGRRERKKQQTRQLISDVARRLFVERGFVTVTVADVADAADVSVNTVYNYFPTKEDLVFDREEETVDLPSYWVRERGPGVSAAEAVLAGLRRDVTERSPWVGLKDDWHKLLRMVQEAASLRARLLHIQYRTADRLTETLRAEVDAPPEDPLPELVAVQLMGVQGVVQRTVGRCAQQRRPVDETAELVLAKLDAAESLLSEAVRDYARRPETWTDRPQWRGPQQAQRCA